MSELNITNNDIISAWGNAPQDATERHGDEGDFARQHLLNPALFSLSGDVQGKKGYAYTFHRPLSTYLNLLIEKECIFQTMIEPRLDEELVRRYGRQHARNVFVPQFVIIHSIKM